MTLKLAVSRSLPSVQYGAIFSFFGAVRYIKLALSSAFEAHVNYHFANRIVSFKIHCDLLIEQRAAAVCVIYRRQRSAA